MLFRSAVELVPAAEKLRGSSKGQAVQVVGKAAVAQHQVRDLAEQCSGDASARPFEVGVQIVDLHPGELGQFPRAGIFRMGEEEQPAVLRDLARELGGRRAVAQGDARAHPGRHQAVAHLEPGDEESSAVQAAPLHVEAGAADGQRVVAQHDEIKARRLHRPKDVGERHLAVVGKLRVAVHHAAELAPSGILRYWLPLCAQFRPRGLRARKYPKASMNRRRAPHQQGQKRERRGDHQHHPQRAQPAAPKGRVRSIRRGRGFHRRLILLLPGRRRPQVSAHGRDHRKIPG